MTRRDAMLCAIGLAGVGLLALIRDPAVIRALQFAFVLGSAAPIGATLLLAIARLTGADWSALMPLTRPLPVFVPLAVLAMVAGGGAALPAHLAIWQHPLFVAMRAALAIAALAWAAARLREGSGTTMAGITLALYAATVTAVAADWLLAGEPGHPVSAIGMMLFVLQIAAACAALLFSKHGSAPMRSDMAKLLVAALLGLGYLAFMDYLIVWFGNLPARVPFYVVRTGVATGSIAVGAVLIGIGIPIAALSLMPPARGQRLAASAALGGSAMFLWWWLGGALATVLIGLALLAIAGAVVRPSGRGPAHG